MIRKVIIRIGDVTQDKTKKFRDEVEQAMKEILLNNGLEAEGTITIWEQK